MNSNPGTFVLVTNSSSWTAPPRQGRRRCLWTWWALPSTGHRWVRGPRARCRQSLGPEVPSRTPESSLGSSLGCKCPVALSVCAVRLDLHTRFDYIYTSLDFECDVLVFKLLGQKFGIRLIFKYSEICKYMSLWSHLCVLDKNLVWNNFPNIPILANQPHPLFFPVGQKWF